MNISIPSYILPVMKRLESGGFEAWVVGGCVRDALLGLEPHDWDLCTSATPAEMKTLFREWDLVLAGEKHGTVSVITGPGLVEVTTYRSEGDYADGRHPQWVRFEDQVEADLSRRDFTINAMAYHPERGLKDPWGGRQDLANRILRAVRDPRQRFTEDGLRILRGIRFTARFSLEPDPETLAAMVELAHTLEKQARERVFSELCSFLPVATARDLERFAPIVTAAIPDLVPMVGFLQHNPHHVYDVYGHTAHVVEAVGPDLALRWAALLHDVAKPHTLELDETGCGHFYGHARQGAILADQILRDLKAPNALRHQVVTLVEHHSLTRSWLDLDQDKPLRRFLAKHGPQILQNLLQLDQADLRGKGTGNPVDYAPLEARIQALLQEKPCLSMKDLALGGKDLMDLGIPQGKTMGQILNRLLEQVVEGELPNDRQVLLARARELLHEIAL